MQLPESFFLQKARTAGLPPRFLYIRKSPLTTQLQSILGEALKKHSPLCLTGACETGKSLTLAILARFICFRASDFNYINCLTFPDKLRDNIDQQAAWKRQLSNVRHLFLDDVGGNYDKSGWWSAWLLDILDQRYQKQLPTSSSTNNPASIEPRIWRRLTEFALCKELKAK